MKTFATGLAGLYASGEGSLCTCLRIARLDGQVFTATSWDEDVVVSGVTLPSGVVVDGSYRAVHGLEATDLQTSEDLAVGNLELSFVPEDGDDVLMQDLLLGRFTKAAFVIFECDPADPAAGVNVLARGWAGDAELVEGGAGKLQLRSLKHAYRQPLGVLSSKTCRARFADYPQPLPDARCGLTVADWTEAGTLTSVTSRQVVTDSSRAEAADWFGDGILRVLTGANAGTEVRIKSFAAGVFTLARALDADFEVGDGYEAIAGCRKRHERTADNPSGASDCVDKFNNLLNFQGEPHAPQFDQLLAGSAGAE